jgi:hypothetical protein
MQSMLNFRRFAPVLGLLVCGLLALPVQAADADKYLPNDSEAVITLNVKQLLEAPLIKNNLEQLKGLVQGIGGAQGVLDDLGFDPFKDVDTVTVAMVKNPNQAMLLVSGKFDPAKIAAQAEKVAKNKPDTLKVTKSGNYTIYEAKAPEKNETVYTAVVDGGLLVASPNKSAVVDVLDKKAGMKQTELKKDLQAALTAGNRQQSISITSLAGPLAASGQPFVEKIKTLSGGITVTDEVKAEVVLNAKDAKDAKSIETELNDNLDMVKALVDNAAQVNQGLKPLVDAVGTLKLSSQGNNVTLKGLISKEVIQSLNKLIPQ